MKHLIDIVRRGVKPMYIGLVLVLPALAVAACSSPEAPVGSPSGPPTSSATMQAPNPEPLSPPPAPEPSKTITLTFEAAADGKSVEISGTADLPDGAILDIGLDRLIRNPEYDEAGEGPGYLDVDWGESLVREERFSFTLVDNRGRNAQEYADAYNEGEPASRHLTVTDTVEVTVSFSPRNEGQSQTVIAAAGGPNGAKLANSPQAHQLGGWTNDPYWTLQATKQLQLPAP